MRILVEPSDYVLRNVGDIAMMAVCVKRLREQFPSASIEVFTDQPCTLPRYVAQATPYPSSSRSAFLETPLFPKVPSLIRRLIEPELRRSFPDVTRGLLIATTSDMAARNLSADFLKKLDESDCLIVAGMGGITDYFPDYAQKLLHTLVQAGSCGTYIAMMGQGIGPLRNPRLRRLAKTAFRGVRLFGLREGVFGPTILKSLGVSDSRIVCTGDDAIADAYALRSTYNGTMIGMNLRMSDYAAIDETDAAWIGGKIASFASKVNSGIVPIPISFVPGEADQETYRRVRAMTDRPTDSSVPSVATVVEQIQHCKFVVSGSYHAAVFALSSGIPCVCVSASTYYNFKFAGLAAQFGAGCTHVDLTRAKWRKDFEAGLRSAWTSAADLRSPLLRAAAEQIERSKAAYARLAAEITQEASQGAV